MLFVVIIGQPGFGAGPKHDSGSSTATITHTEDTSAGVPNTNTTTYPAPNAFTNSSSPPAVPAFSSFSNGDSAATSEAGIGHQTLSKGTGYAVTSHPGAIGVAAIDTDNVYNGPTRLNQTFTNQWDITKRGWRGPIFAYATFLLGVNLSLADTASFSASFTHQLDLAGDGFGGSDPQQTITLATGGITGTDLTPRVLFGSALLHNGNVPKGAIYTVTGQLTFETEDKAPAGIVSSNSVLGTNTVLPNALPPGDSIGISGTRFFDISGQIPIQIEGTSILGPNGLLTDFRDVIPNLPEDLRFTQGSGTFGTAVPLPAAHLAGIALLGGLGALRVIVRRRGD